MSLDLATKLKYMAPFRGYDFRQPHETYQGRQKDPWRYLDVNVGVEKICEMLMHGIGPRDIAHAINLAQGVIMKWIEADQDRLNAYEWAFAHYADNTMYEARDILDNAPLLSEAINKAGKQAEHRRHMAKGFGAKRWGNKVDINQTMQATVSYNFNVALLPQQKAALEGQYTQVSKDAPPMVNFNDLLGGSNAAADLVIPGKEKMSYEEAEANEKGSEET